MATAKKPNKKAVTEKRTARKPKSAATIEFKEGLKNIERIETVPLASIDVEDRRFQYRVKEKTTDILPSLVNEGQLVPVILWGEAPPYTIIDGYRRIAAITSLGWPTVRAIIRNDIDEEGAYRLSFIENVKRKNFSALDMAYAIWKMQARGKTNDDLEKEFNLSSKQIYRYKSLIEFPQPIKIALAEELITMAHAQVLNAANIRNIEPWLEKITNGLSASRLKRELNKEVGRQIKAKQYFKKEKDGFRLFPMRFSFNMSSAKQKKILQVLTRAVEIIKSKSEK